MPIDSGVSWCNDPQEAGNNAQESGNSQGKIHHQEENPEIILQKEERERDRKVADAAKLSDNGQHPVRITREEILILPPEQKVQLVRNLQRSLIEKDRKIEEVMARIAAAEAKKLQGTHPTGYPSHPSYIAPILPITQGNHDGCTFFTVTLRKDEACKKYGLTPIDGKSDFRKRYAQAKAPAPEHLIVKRVAIGGLLEKWNEDHPDAKVIPADRIVAVNQIKTVTGMKKEFQAPKVAIRIARYPMTFEAEFTKEVGTELGISFQKVVNTRLQELSVTIVAENGLVAEYNKQKVKEGHWHAVILPEMRITFVNDVSGDPNAMAEEIVQSTTVRIRFRRMDIMHIVRNKVQAKVNILKGFAVRTKKD